MRLMIGQARAQHWLAQMEGQTINWGDASNAINGFPVLIRQSGLALAIATYKTASTRGQEKAFIINALADWLMKNSDKNGSPYEEQNDEADAAGLMKRIQAGSIKDYAIVLAETMAWLEWGKNLLAMKKQESSGHTNGQAEAEAGEPQPETDADGDER